MDLSESKYSALLRLLRQYKKIGIAFSGGVDSTLLLYAAVETLGKDNVIAIYMLSSLNSAGSVQNTREVFAENFPNCPILQEIEVHPLTWEEFVVNDRDRCYFCKKRMYTAMQTALYEEHCFVLADGTNIDDLKEDRPGLRAIRELDVKTPLVDVGLNKGEIRSLAKAKGLTNFNLPSNSCLATRIQRHKKIDRNMLRLIEDAEGFLHQLGFSGCRVKVLEHCTLIEVKTEDFDTFIDHTVRVQVRKYFLTLGLGPVMLSLEGR